MEKHQLIVHDNRDDRKEFVLLLACLPPKVRLAWLVDCCRRAHSPHYKEVKPQVKREMFDLAEKARWDDNADSRLTQECFQDVIFMSAQYKFNLEAALKRLVSLAKKHGKTLSWRRG